MKTLSIALVAALVWALPANGWAQVTAADMQGEMETYFEGERLGGITFMTIGAGSVVAGGLLLASDSDFLKGMSYPMLGLGAVQMLVGGIVILQSGPRIDQFTDAISQDPGGYVADELPRMEGVDKSFTALFVTEIVLITGGVTAAVLTRRKGWNTWAGVSAGLATQAALILGQDVFAARRARQYTLALEGFEMTIAPAARSLHLAYGRAF